MATCLLPKISGVEVTPSLTSVESSEQFWRICEPCYTEPFGTHPDPFIDDVCCYSLRIQVTPLTGPV